MSTEGMPQPKFVILNQIKKVWKQMVDDKEKFPFQGDNEMYEDLEDH